MNEPTLNQSPEAQSLWYYADSRNEPVGPLPMDVLQRLAGVGVISPDTHVIEKGGTEWKKFSSIVPPPARGVPDGQPTVKTQPTTKEAIQGGAVLVLLVIAITLWHYLRPLLYLAGFLGTWVAVAWFGQRAKQSKTLSIGGGFIATCIALALVLELTGAGKVNTNQRGERISDDSATGTQHPIKRLGLNEQFRLGDFTYSVVSCHTSSSIGSSFSRTKAARNGIFVIVNYSVMNETSKTQTVVSDDFFLRDSKGRTFRPSSNALTALMMENTKEDFLLTELQPGLAQDTVTAFEMPNDVAHSTLYLIVPEKGFFGSKKIEVCIQ